MPASSQYFPYQVHRRPLAPSHAIFEAGNLDRELLARESAPAVRLMQCKWCFPSCLLLTDHLVASRLLSLAVSGKELPCLTLQQHILLATLMLPCS